jgi:hypothetical protein
MPMPSNPLAEAERLRNLANRTRRMAAGLTQRSDRDRLERYADGLEQRAAALEEQAGPASPRLVTQDQQQVQQQQQHQAEPPPGNKR